MIYRRSSGDADYIAGICAYLTERNEPPSESPTYRGYLDAHDMVAHLSEISSDLRAEAFEEEAKLVRQRSLGSHGSVADRNEEIRSKNASARE
jgi:hypothetical protein